MLMRAVFSIIAIILLFSSADALAKRRSVLPDPKKYAAYVMHADSGTILHEEKAIKVRHPASLTKLMTLYLTFEALKKGKLKLNRYINASRKVARQPSLKIGLRRGDKITTRNAIYAVVVKSANDAATLLAEAISGSEEKFAKLMTHRARQLGMRHTTFKNASGLHHRKQITTAKDMAKLIVALERDFPQYYHFLRKRSFSYRGKLFKTHNALIKNYKGASAGKTGYINASGFNLVTAAKRNGRKLVGVVLGGKTARSRDKIMTKILDKGFRKLEGNYKMLSRMSKNFPVPHQKPDTLATAKASNIWSIKVGDFKDERQAVTAVSHAMDLAPAQLAYAPISLSHNISAGEKSHWAKFIDLTEKQAREACSSLRLAKRACQVLAFE